MYTLKVYIVYCSQESLHFQPCKNKQYVLLAHLKGGGIINNGNIKLCVVPSHILYMSLCDKLGDENDYCVFKVTLLFLNVFFFISFKGIHALTWQYGKSSNA